MTNPAILEALVKAISAAYDNALMHGERAAAAAVLELVGPRELVWAKIHWENYTSRPYLINIMHWPDTPTDHKLYIEKDDGDNFLGNFPTIEAAKSAAQAHADAAHWANTKIGGE